jgi:hypothetical protein
MIPKHVPFKFQICADINCQYYDWNQTREVKTRHSGLIEE